MLCLSPWIALAMCSPFPLVGSSLDECASWQEAGQVRHSLAPPSLATESQVEMSPTRASPHPGLSSALGSTPNDQVQLLQGPREAPLVGRFRGVALGGEGG